MSSGALREAFARLLRENQSHQATLSADAVKAIRGRVAGRWAGGIGTLVVVGSLAVGALAIGTGSGEVAPTTSPVPTPTFGFAAANFPMTGGPEFVPASSELRCGDPAPAPNSIDQGLKLEVQLGASAVTGEGEGEGGAAVPSARAVLSPVTNEVRGTLSTSGIDILVIQDGIIRGIFDGGTTELDVALSYQNPGEWPRLLVAERTECPSDTGQDPSGATPGTYELIAIGRVFSTPESVALSQAVASAANTQFLDPDIQADPHAVYLPGSYDCRQLLSFGSVARACLPDLTDSAVVDAKAGTVSVLYKTKALVDEFSTVLVSEPLTANLVSSALLRPADWEPWDGISPFDTLESFTCGSVGLGLAVNLDAPYLIEAEYDVVSIAEKQKGGTFAGTVFVPDAPDGSQLELLQGARLVFLKDYTLVSPYGMSTTNVSTVVASSPLTTSGSFISDRFTGPQDAMFTNDAATLCPDVDPDLARGNVHAALVGQWLVTMPDGIAVLIDSANDPSLPYGYVR